MPSTRKPAAGSPPSCPWMPAGGLSPLRQSLAGPANRQSRRVVPLSRIGSPPSAAPERIPTQKQGPRPPQALCKLNSLRAGAPGGRGAGKSASTAPVEKSNRGYSPARPGGDEGLQPLADSAIPSPGRCVPSERKLQSLGTVPKNRRGADHPGPIGGSLRTGGRREAHRVGGAEDGRASIAFTEARGCSDRLR